jgi:hypothetical protein
MLHHATRISVSEAAILAGRDRGVVELAIKRGELPYVRSGARRVVRTTPAWVNDWVRGRGR